MQKNIFYQLHFSLIITLCLILLVSCGNVVSMPVVYDYEDLSEYIKLANYKELEYTAIKVAVSQKEIDEYIDNQLKHSATDKKKVTSGVAKKDSVANIDFVGSINGVELKDAKGKNYDLDLANSTFIDGFAEEIIGHKVGETFDVNVTFPEDYGNKKINGKKAVFVTTINYLTETVFPEYNLEYVKNNTEYESIKEYENGVKEQIMEEKKSQAEKKDRELVFKKIVKESKVLKYPEREYNMKVSTLSNEKEAKQKLKEELVLYAIVQAEGLKITDSGFQKYIDGVLSEEGITAEDFEERTGMNLAEYVDGKELGYSFIYEEVMDKVMSYAIKK